MIGTPLFGRKINSDGNAGEVTVVRAGMFDDAQVLNEGKPEVEIYTDRRLKWLTPIQGADQVGEMLLIPSLP